MSEQKGRRAGLPSFSIRRPIGTVMLSSVVVVLGVFAASALPLDLLPSIVYPQVRVNVNNAGVEPEVLEETVAKPLEQALATTENLVRIETEVQEGRVGLNLHFRYGTDIDFALQDASRNLERARSRLPQEADPATIFKFDPSQMPIYEAGFSSGTRDLISLREWVDNRLRPQLMTVEGIATIDISGGLEREIQVILDQERLRSYGLTVAQIMDAIRASNQDVAAGRVTSDTWEVVGTTAGKFRSVDDLRGVVLNVAGGRRVPLSEVAEIRDTNREQRLWVRLNGVPAVKLSVRKQPDANTVAVAEGVDQRLRELEAMGFMPGDIRYSVLQNQADFIRNSISSVRNAAVLGAFLAMLMVLFFLGSLRKTFVIGLAIPIAVLATFFLMGRGGLTLNIMSLGGLALGVGLLIDNSIVMLENIFRHTEGNADPQDAAHKGAGEVQSALLAATATNLAAVIPFLLISGLAALIFRELVLTISFAIMASLGVALTLVPMAAAQIAKIRFRSGVNRLPPLRAFDAGVQALRRGYRTLAGGALRWRWAVLGVAVLALVGAYSLTRDLGNEFLPQVDDGGVGVMIRLSPGAPAEQTNRIALEIERMITEMPDVEHVFATAGGMLWGSGTSERAGRGSIDVRLVPHSRRTLSADEWVAMLQERVDERGFAGARIGVRPPRIRGLRTSSSGSDVALQLQGEELDELQRIAEEIVAAVAGIPGLQNVQASAEEASPQLAIRLDRERAAYLGLNVATVGQTLRTALDGTIVTRYTEGNREFDVRVMLPRDQFTSPEALRNVALFPALAAGGAPVYLRDVADVYNALGPGTITRENQNRILELSGDVLTEVAPVGVVNDSIRTRLAGLDLPEGYALIYGGEEEAIRESNRQLLVVVLLAVFLVFAVLAVQYESLVNPFVILLAMPLSLIGVCLALWLTSTPLSAPVLLGVILLAGIVVNNAILLVEYIEQFRKDRGVSMIEAAVEAGVIRLRPIMMTTLTTMLGMTPLALGLGQGSELMRPLAISVVGGLGISALLTLFVVPSAYVIFNTAGEKVKAFLVGGEKVRHEEATGRPQDMIGAEIPATGD